MSNIITSKTRLYRTIKPPVGSVINWGHSLAQGLVGAWLMNEGGGRQLRNIAYNTPNLLPYQYGGLISGMWGLSTKGRCTSTIGAASWQGAFSVGTTSYLTVEVLVYPSATAAGQGYLTQWHGGDGLKNFYIGSGIATISNFGVKSGVTTLESGTNFSTNAWHHVVGVLDGVNMTLYVDGVLVGSTAFSTAITIGTKNVCFFNDAQDASRTSGGTKILLGRIWKRALSPSEIQSLYEAPYQMIQGPRSRSIIPYGITGGGGGTLYNQLCNESISASDVYARSWNMGRFLADSVTPTDILSRIIKANRIFGDAITPTDSLFRALKANRIFNESVTIGDLATRLWNIVRTCNESITVDDVVSRILKAVRQLSEALTVSDSVTYKTNAGIEYLIELLESFTPSDTITPAKHTLYQLSLVEAMYLNDVLLYWASQVKKTGSWSVVSSSTSAWTILGSSTGSWTRLIS